MRNVGFTRKLIWYIIDSFRANWRRMLAMSVGFYLITLGLANISGAGIILPTMTVSVGGV